MKAIASAIGDGHYQTVINQARTIKNGIRKFPAIFLEAAGLAIRRHEPKYVQILTILLPSPRPLKPRRTDWLQRQNLAIQAR
jgi:hypothetical protein